MGVGDAPEYPYDLPGPLPAGPYHLTVAGFQQMPETGTLTAEVIYRSGGTDMVLHSAAATAQGSSPSIDAMFDAAAVDSASGDQLLIRLSLSSDATNFFEINAALDIP